MTMTITSNPDITFNRLAGTLTKGILSFGGIYSGDLEHFNQPSFDQLPKQGPIPGGLYRLHFQAEHPPLGKYVFSLEPIGGQPMFGRGGFFIHGDSKEINHTASEGCIIAPYSVRVVLKDGSSLLVV